MKLVSCIVAHNRVELTRRCVESYLATVTVPHVLIVVDNGSTDGTLAWLDETAREEPRRFFWFSFGGNLYPGRACNDGWEAGLGDPIGYDPDFTLEDATHLHRSDNDVEFLPGWCDSVARALETACPDCAGDGCEWCGDTGFVFDPNIGQLGLLEEKYERGAQNVGGNCIIRRELWDAGLRYREQPWHDLPGDVNKPTEDCYLSLDILARGYRVERVRREVIVHHGWDWDAYPDYYEQSARVRGMDPVWLRQHFEHMKALRT